MARRWWALAVLVPLLAGCSGAPRVEDRSTVAVTPPATAVPASTAGSTPSAAGPFNATDVMFLQMLLTHHEPATRLLALGRTQAARPEVRDLAGRIEAVQRERTDAIRAMLAAWGQPTDSAAHPDEHAAHGGLPVLDEREIDTLASTGPEQFDTAFLNMLIGHQHAAVNLTRMEAASGRNPQVRDLARRTDEQVRGQIQLMLRMVAG